MLMMPNFSFPFRCNGLEEGFNDLKFKLDKTDMLICSLLLTAKDAVYSLWTLTHPMGC